ncbi:MAG TPA: hypothetical protein PLP13_03450 [bacterium]|nr:hypothetical protein [bacterium]
MADIIKLNEVSRGDLPERLRVEFYFDFKKYPFRHQDLFTRPDVISVISALDAIHPYACEWIKKPLMKRKKPVL